MKSLCGADCANCQWNSTCPGCDHEKCFIARYIKKDGREYKLQTKDLCAQARKAGINYRRNSEVRIDGNK